MSTPVCKPLLAHVDTYLIYIYVRDKDRRHGNKETETCLIFVDQNVYVLILGPRDSRVCMYVCVCVCMYVCVYIYIYMYIRTVQIVCLQSFIFRRAI